MLVDLINNNTKKMNTKPILKNVDIEDIIENEMNFYRQEDIDMLVQSIDEYGLQKPLEVFENDGVFKLIGGHRRFKALNILYSEEKIEAEVPCLIYTKPSNQTEEKMKIILSNSQRDLTQEDKINITKELLLVLETNKEVKQSGLPTRDWIAQFLGCSPRTAQNFINLAMGKPPKENKSSSSEELKTEQKKKNKKENDLDTFIKFLEKENKDLEKLFWNMSEETRNKIISISNDGREIDVAKMINKLMSITYTYVDYLETYKENQK